MLAAFLASVLAIVPQATDAPPRKVAILVFPGVELLDFAGPGEVFAAAWDGRSCFEVFTVAETREPVISQGFVEIRPGRSFDDCPQPDIVVIPGGDVPDAPRVRDWLSRTAPGCEITMSVCNGALLLADCGLLAGLEATTHHSALEALALRAPRTAVFEGRRVVDNGRVVTAAGVSAGIDGALHLVKRLHGERVAQATARYMEYRWDPAVDAAADAVSVSARPLVRVVRTAVERGVDTALAELAASANPPDEASLNRAGYTLMDASAEDALQVFELVTRRFPESPNAWDSLGDGYENLGRGDDATRCARKALELLDADTTLEPARRARIRAAAEQKLPRPRGDGAPGIGETAPDFTLQDVDGAAHVLADLRGRVVVLEWTSDLCPAVAGHFDDGRMQEARARCEQLGAAWLAIDSSAGCERRTADIRAWRTANGATWPCLLDPDGTTGHAFGATTTPELFVIDAEGVLAYRGALDGSVPAVEALRNGLPVPVAELRALGCSIKYREPPEAAAVGDGDAAGPWLCPPCPVDCHDLEHPARGACPKCGMTLIPKAEFLRLVDAGRTRAAAGAAAVDPLRGDFAAGRLSRELGITNPALAPWLADPERRTALRALLKEHPGEAQLTIAPASEPGTRMHVMGTVLAPEDRSPLAGALVYLYHTDATGAYVAGDEDSGGSDNPRLFGFVRAGADGRFTVDSIVPASYPGTTVPRHVHAVVESPGRAPRFLEWLFADDPLCTPEVQRQAARERWPIVEPRARADGSVEYMVDLFAGER